MIEFTRAYVAGGKAFANLEEAQREELLLALKRKDQPLPATWQTSEVVDAILANADKIVDILTTGEKSRPRGRKANGASRKRKSDVVPMPDAPPYTEVEKAQK